MPLAASRRTIATRGCGRGGMPEWRQAADSARAPRDDILAGDALRAGAMTIGSGIT
jgi:hypothetical protein